MTSNTTTPNTDEVEYVVLATADFIIEETLNLEVGDLEICDDTFEGIKLILKRSKKSKTNVFPFTFTFTFAS